MGKNFKKARKQLNYYDMNMSALANRYPEYVELVRTAERNRKDSDYELTGGKFDKKGLKIKSTGKNYCDTDVIQGVKENIGTFDLRGARLVVYLGFGLGYDPLFYTEQVSQQSNTQNMIVIEKDPALFNMAMKLFDLRSFINQPRIHILLGVPAEKIFSEIANWLNIENRYYNARAYQIIYNQSAFDLDYEYYDSVIKSFASADIYAINNYGNDTEDSLIGTENMFANINEIIDNPGINLLKDKFKGKPAVCIATGPSLN